MCYLEWTKWSDSPILITRDPSVVTHEPIIFPVITMCSTNKISKKKLADVLQEPKLLLLLGLYTVALSTDEPTCVICTGIVG